MERLGTIKVGTRSSRLALRQTEGAIAFLKGCCPGSDWDILPVSTPGDRDLTTPIESAAGDFFTRDLDDAVLSGAVDCAIHSAKDMPERPRDGLDWMWLPCREDRRDAVVSLKGASDRLLRDGARIGVSSSRRREYAQRKWPKAELLPMRGAVDARLTQIEEGRFDGAIMALAGLNRLGLDLSRFDIVPIPEAELKPPEGQGVLAVAFRLGDRRFVSMRDMFVKAVRFASAGVGDAQSITVRCARDVAEADITLADTLIPHGLKAMLRPRAEWVDVGKRCGKGARQEDITRLILDEARKLKRVVRLKGGDAGLFGRLSEETDALEAHGIPFVVRPGVSALLAASTGTGMLLTRRGEARGFRVFTPRSTGSEENEVAFMGTKVMDGGTMVYDAMGPREEIVKGWAQREDDRPGVLLNGPCTRHVWPRLGLLKGARVLVTASDDVSAHIRTAIEDFGGRAVMWPMVRLEARADSLDGVDVHSYDALILSSPAAVRCFFETWKGDIRHLPEIWTTGAQTAEALLRHGIEADLYPSEKSCDVPRKSCDASGKSCDVPTVMAQREPLQSISGGTRAFEAEIRKNKDRVAGKRFLRLKSSRATAAVKDALLACGAASVDEIVLYDNLPIYHLNSGTASVPSSLGTASCKPYPLGTAPCKPDPLGTASDLPHSSNPAGTPPDSGTASVASNLGTASGQTNSGTASGQTGLAGTASNSGTALVMPIFDAVHFASASAVHSFLDQYGEETLKGKKVYAIGAPTESALPPSIIPIRFDCLEIWKSEEGTIGNCWKENMRDSCPVAGDK